MYENKFKTTETEFKKGNNIKKAVRYIRPRPKKIAP
jgi:hypothetical protein